MNNSSFAESPASIDVSAGGREVSTLRDLTPQQWKSGVAAWLGWMFDGLDMHLYTLVALPFVAELVHLNVKHETVGYLGSWIQASFLIGWAVGGSFFGIIGDRIGRSRALMLTILTYAIFTGLSYFAREWWHLLIFRFVAALGIGGEWAVGASLLSETWPRRWRPWIAAVLQSAVNIGVIAACAAGWLMAGLPPRSVFLVGVVPALLVLWIRRAVPETEEWSEARNRENRGSQRIAELFRGDLRRTTVLTLAVCALGLTAHWAFMFWYLQHLRNLPEVAQWSDADRTQLASIALLVVMAASITGNFLAAAVARVLGYRRAILLSFVGYFLAMSGAYFVPRSLAQFWPWLVAIGMCQGVFALFTMYMPPLFPTLLRTTGAGFCYNCGRIAAAFGTVFFGLFTKVGDFRLALFYASFLFLPAAAVAWLLPELSDGQPAGPVD